MIIQRKLYYESFIRLGLKKVLILGSEDKGIRKLIKKNCDFIVSIETALKKDDIVDSLNVSNACAIILNQLTTKNETTA